MPTLPKNLICPLPVQDPKGSIDLLSRLPVHADARDEEDYDGSAAVRRGKILTRVDMYFGAAYELDI